MSDKPARVLRLPEVLWRVGVSRSQWYRLEQLGVGPRRIKLGEHSSGWLEADVDRFIASRVAESRQPEAA